MEVMSRWDDVTAHLEHRVTFSETDGLGFVHHGNVASWFERGRETFFRRFHQTPAELTRSGHWLAMRQLNVRYDSFVGYESGLPSPAYYDAVWEKGPEAAAGALLEAAVRRLRAKKQPVSPAAVAAAAGSPISSCADPSVL